MNFNMALLLEMADRFKFVVDVRGVWPIMIQGMRTLEYRTHRDALHFISVDQQGRRII
jgi:hypothetical protein